MKRSTGGKVQRRVNSALTDKYAVLKKYFGYDSFRSGQEEITDSLTGKRDVLAVMSTGAGKSLCYQIPALLMRGITLVISPLISLMQDQVRILKAAGVPAAYLNSSLHPAQISLAIERASAGWYKIIYVAPERLKSQRFIDFALNTEISMIAVDEAHCISMWGHEFRPGYREIADFIALLPERPVTAAFTATADSRVREDIMNMLRLREPFVYISGFDRPNLYFSVVNTDDSTGMDFSHNRGLEYLCRYVSGRRNESGIIYCMTRNRTQKVYEALSEAGIPSCIYHAGLDVGQRQRLQEDFTFDRVKVIVATSAFGMGIDKPDVRYVIHYGIPPSIEDYYQQAGRAGRDGEKADCILISDYGSYMLIKNNFILRPRDEEEDSLSPDERKRYISVQLDKLGKMYRYASSEKICLRKILLEYFGEAAPDSCGGCSVCRRKSLTVKENDTVNYDRDLYAKLKAHVKILSLYSGVPVYAIAGEAVLKEIAAVKPGNINALRKINGLGAEKIRKYGEDIIKIVNESR